MTVAARPRNGGTAENTQLPPQAQAQNAQGSLRPPHEHVGRFERFARGTALLAGRPPTFFAAFAVVLVWLVTGPIFGFSDTWQLVINTGTTIVTFLMVFLIQQSQNRDTMALQVKLAELIIAMKGADNVLATAEDLSEHELAALHADYCRKADTALEHLETRHGKEAVRAALKKARAPKIESNP